MVEILNLPEEIGYSAALQKLMSLIDLERSNLSGPRQKQIYDLSRIEAFLLHIQNPHFDVPCIHVAGTKGKGSVSAICESILRSSGCKTGFFSSPHLHSFTERIRIDGKPLARYKFATYFDELWSEHEKWSKAASCTKLTLFEFITALAFWVFSKESVDVGVIEVGLGGRLDATNVITPEVSVITALGYDHTAILGEDIESIAKEKAGIVKPGVPVVVSEQIYDVMDTIKSICAKNDAKLINVTDICTYSSSTVEHKTHELIIQAPVMEGMLRTSLLGKHQAQNVLTALCVTHELIKQGWEITKNHISEGVTSVSWPCRLELIESEPQQIVLDGAHSYESVKLVLDSIPEIFQYDKLGIILGLSRDKDTESICELIVQHSPDSIHIIKSRHPKAMEPLDIKTFFPGGLSSLKIPLDIKESLCILREELGIGSLILSIGSLFSSAEIREYLLEIEPEHYYPNL